MTSATIIHELLGIEADQLDFDTYQLCTLIRSNVPAEEDRWMEIAVDAGRGWRAAALAILQSAYPSLAIQDQALVDAWSARESTTTDIAGPCDYAVHLPQPQYSGDNATLCGEPGKGTTLYDGRVRTRCAEHSVS